MGFADAARAERLLRTDLRAIDPDSRRPDSGEYGDRTGAGAVLAALAGAADPDLALTGLARLAGAANDPEALYQALRDEPDFRDRLAAVLGVSAGLADHLTRHPEDADQLRGDIGRPEPAELREQMLRAVGADPRLAEPVAAVPVAAGPDAAGPEPVAALAAAYRRRLLHLAARDLTGAATVDEVGEELADLAAAILEAALAVARSELPGGTQAAAPCRLAVVAMGKCGGRELNYASDVDVIFVAEPTRDGDETAALATAGRLAAGLIGVCARSTPEGSIVPVDPNLRPEGRSGPLVRTLASHRAYYERWAKTWEFQALLKARPVAGDLALGQAYADTFGPLVWEAARREHFVEDVQAMRRRVEDSLPARRAGRELKLGPGGLRDIEFAVQLLQLVHGRTDETLRAPATLPALAALAAGGYVGRADAEELAAAYRFLRRTEHLLQLHRLSRTHTLPEDPAVLRRLGRAMRGIDSPNEPSPGPANRADPAAEFDAMWRQHARQVRRLHEKLFYRPLLNAVARLPSDASRLTPAEARARLEALGYTDPAGALRHIDALASGVSRRAAIQRTLLPVLLGWFADAAEPDAGLLAFRQVSDALGQTPWYLRLLRDETKAAERMAHVLASSRYATGLLLRAPEAVAMFGDDAELVPRSLDALRSEMMAAAQRHGDDAEAAATAVRSARRRELLRIASADLIGVTPDLAATAEALTSVTRATVEAALAVAARRVSAELGQPLPTRFAVIAMGRFGGHECGYGSDADVLFVHDPLPGQPERLASDAAHAVAAELRRLLALPVPDPALVVDADLRPEGRQGPLVRTLAAYRAYYRRWSAPWEAQALLRAEPAAGDAGLGAEFTAMIAEFRYPAGSGEARGGTAASRYPPGPGEAGGGTRMGRDRRGGGPRDPPGQGPGGSRADPARRGPGAPRQARSWRAFRRRVDGPAAAASARPRRARAADHQDQRGDGRGGPGRPAGRRRRGRPDGGLGAGRRIRNAIVLVRGRPGDTLPTKHGELTAVARLLGYPPGDAAQALEQDYRRAARRARTVMESVFYG